MTFSQTARQQLLSIAARAIRIGTQKNQAMLAIPPMDSLPAELLPPAACFVSLYQKGALRGCVGTLEATEPVGISCARYAFQAAFHDSRFKPVKAADLETLETRLSVLTSPEPIEATSSADLLAFLAAHQEGIVLEWGAHRGTFLPEVWEQIPEPRAFLHRLKEKAQIPPEVGPPDLRAFHYTTITIAR